MAMQEVIKEANNRDILTVADFWGMNMNRMLMQLTGLHGWGHTGSFGEAMHREMQLLVMAGIPPLDVITMCTSEAAKILRSEEPFGSLRAGLSADILIVEGNPAENISASRNVRHVFFKGDHVDRDALKFSE